MNQHLRCGCSLGALGFLVALASCSSDGPGGSGPSSGGSAGVTIAGSTGTSGASAAGASGSSGTGGVGNAGTSGSNAAAGVAGAAVNGGNTGSAGNAGTAGTTDPIPGSCAPVSDINAPYQKLSQTGCMSATEPTKFAAKAVPYEVNSPLWSDSADKTRAMVIPARQIVHIKNCAVAADGCTQGPADTGQWVFPIGTVMLKNFSFDNKVVETRLFIHHDAQTWVGYSYRWDEAQTEATINPAEDPTKVMFNTGTRTVPWVYPSRTQCMKCHDAKAGSTLGPETRQMNREVAGKNQIDRLIELGLLGQGPTKPYAAAYATPYAGQAGPATTGTTEEKARSYMHANCAFCHRPDGEFPQIDMRYDTPLAQMGVCNVTPLKGDQGVLNSVELKPGEPANSVIYLRMNALPGAGRMPAIATNQIDTAGVKLISDWITGVTSCPPP